MSQTVNESINLALMRLSRRSEKVAPETLVRTFVDIGSLFTLLSIVDNQIIFGRRGTGKTHALRYLAETRKASGDAAIYLDLSNIGSSGGIYADQSLSVTERATRLLVDTLVGLHDELYEFCVDYAEKHDLSVTGPILDELGMAITDVRVVGQVEEEVSGLRSQVKREEGSGEAKLSPNDVKVSLARNKSSELKTEGVYSRRIEGQLHSTVHFGSVRRILERLSKAINPVRIWVLLDEWSSVPLDLQPYLADLLRRSIFPITGFTVKSAAIEYRSAFKMAGPQGSYVGIEVGADISADINLDDFMVFDNDAERAREFYISLLHKHVIGSGLSGDEVGDQLDERDLVRQAFTQINAFDELVRAAEGVPRDAIHIASLAAQYALRVPIGVPHVRRAAKYWYQTGKESTVRAREEAIGLLHWIIDNVIGNRKARAFLLRSNITHPLIEELFDARVIHVLKRGVSTHDQPGARYDVYKLDYGCYVDLMATARAPLGLFLVDEEDDSSGYIEVPQDDYRSIRRAILDLEDFERARS